MHPMADIKPRDPCAPIRRVRAARIATIALLAALALSRAAGAGSVQRGFRVGVELNAPPVQVAAPAKSVALNNPAAAPHALSVTHALSIRAVSTGYMLRLEVVDPAVRSVEILGLGRPLRLTSGVREVFVPPGTDADELALSYTVTYAQAVEPGESSIPFRATIVP